MAFHSKRNCCVINCSNSGYHLNKWREGFCNIHQCNLGTSRCICDPPFELFPFPTERKNPHDRKVWIKNVNRTNEHNKIWEPNNCTRICSKHFVEGKPTLINPYPTLHLGYDKHVSIQKPRLPPLQRSGISPAPPCRKRLRIDEEVTNVTLHDHDYRASCENCDDKNKLISNLKMQIKRLQLELIVKKRADVKKVNIIDLVTKSNESVKFYTGIPTLEAFNAIFKLLEPKMSRVRYWRGTKYTVSHILQYKRIKPKTGISMKDEFILTLMKLRLGLVNKDLADRFHVSESFVSKVFTTWIRAISKFFGSLVFNPPKEIVRENLPPSFKTPRYTSVRHIIDCSEVFIETPHNLEAQSASWSDYKHHHTAKFLLSINPSGLINFVSDCWGGRTSDKFITLNSGFLDIIEPFDTVMADRGFPIREELTLQQAYLLIPPGRRGATQMSGSEVKETQQIANRRIYVEQAIRRMKQFRIIKYELPLLLLQHLDYIVKTIAGICNLYPPLPKYSAK